MTPLLGSTPDSAFDIVGDEDYRDLVIARMVEPTSLLDIDQVLATMGRVSASLSTRKRTLGKGPVATRCFTTMPYQRRRQPGVARHVLATAHCPAVVVSARPH
ncbi:hypothetical protein GCM10029976_093090 [Kribbella albertanoniae]